MAAFHHARGVGHEVRGRDLFVRHGRVVGEEGAGFEQVHPSAGVQRLSLQRMQGAAEGDDDGVLPDRRIATGIDGRPRQDDAQRAQRVGARAELDARDVLQARDLAAVAGLDDDVLELFLGHEAALRVDEQLKLRGVRRRRAAELARRNLHVLLANRAHDVAGREIQRGDLLGIEPHAHRVLAGAEHLRVVADRLVNLFIDESTRDLDLARGSLASVGLSIAPESFR